MRRPWHYLTALLSTSLLFAWFLHYVMDAPWWLVYLASFALGLAWPLPKRLPRLCHRCERGLHPHEYATGECITNYCECPVREPVRVDGEAR